MRKKVTLDQWYLNVAADSSEELPDELRLATFDQLWMYERKTATDAINNLGHPAISSRSAPEKIIPAGKAPEKQREPYKLNTSCL